MTFNIAPESVTRQDQVVNQQNIALALRGELWLHTPVTISSEPVEKQILFTSSLWVGEFCAVGNRSRNKAAVGRVNHVWQARRRVDQVHGHAQVHVRVMQLLPLRNG